MDKIILKKFLKAGFMEKGGIYPTEFGACQGGVISPTLAVMALSGLEHKVRIKSRHQKCRAKIHMIAYADDFVITAATETLLQEKIVPIINEALSEVGLELSGENQDHSNQRRV